MKKPFALSSKKQKKGITPRAIEELFKMLAPMQQYCDIALTCSMTELYMDNLIDLLATKDPKRPPLHLEIKEDSKGSFYIVNLSVHPVNSAEKLNKLITQGINNRKTSRTDMNPDSSRSHLILNIMIEIYNRHTDQVVQISKTLVLMFIYKAYFGKTVIGRSSRIRKSQ